jgi:hypothetical protein
MATQPLLPPFIGARTTLRKQYVRGVWGNYLNRHPLKYMSIDRRFYRGVPTQGWADPPPVVHGPGEH